MTGNGVVPCPWQNCPQGGPMRVANDTPAGGWPPDRNGIPENGGTHVREHDRGPTDAAALRRGQHGSRRLPRPVLSATRESYATGLRPYFAWCAEGRPRRLLRPPGPHRAVGRTMEERDLARATIGRRLSTIAGFYRFAVIDGMIDHSPGVIRATTQDRHRIGDPRPRPHGARRLHRQGAARRATIRRSDPTRCHLTAVTRPHSGQPGTARRRADVPDLIARRRGRCRARTTLCERS